MSGSLVSLPTGQGISVEELLFMLAPGVSLSTGDVPGGPEATGEESKVRIGCLPAKPAGEPIKGWSTGLVAMGTCGLVGEVPRSGESVGVCGE